MGGVLRFWGKVRKKRRKGFKLQGKKRDLNEEGFTTLDEETKKKGKEEKKR